MKNGISLFAVLFFLSACSKKHPVIRVNKSKLNYNSLKDSTASFTIYNSGNSVLVIEDYTVSCPCIIPGLSDAAKIKPGDSLVVPVKLEIDTGNNKPGIVFISLKTNSKPPLESFSFKIN